MNIHRAIHLRLTLQGKDSFNQVRHNLKSLLGRAFSAALIRFSSIKIHLELSTEMDAIIYMTLVCLMSWEICKGFIISRSDISAMIKINILNYQYPPRHHMTSHRMGS